MKIEKDMKNEKDVKNERNVKNEKGIKTEKGQMEQIDKKEQEKRLDYLLKEFKEDSVQYRDLQVGDTYQDKRMLLRSLMNIRMPKYMDLDILKVQDEFLTEEAKEKGIVTLEEIPDIKEQYGSTQPFADRISLWQGDITRLAVDAIVNAANSQMLGCFVPCHRCIDNAIHSAAGIQLRQECSRIMRHQGHEEETGKAKITKGYNLPCKYVLHTVGPIVYGTLRERDCQLLRSCYRSCLELAKESGLESVAFCCISTGEFHFPNDKAAEIAIETVADFMKTDDSIRRVIFNVFTDKDLAIYRQLLVCGLESS